MPAKRDLSGLIFGKLRVEFETEKRTKAGHIIWVCQCECGNRTELALDCLRDKHTTTCGKCTNNKYYEHPEGYMVGVTFDNKEFVFDKKDYELIKPHTWCFDNSGYVCKSNVRLHRFILNPKRNQVVDHIDHDKSNCLRSNLRVCTQSQNMMNQLKQKGSTSSKYKGVTRYPNKWRASIGYQNRTIHIGYYDSEKEAARAYNNAAIKMFNDYALLNDL